MTPLQLVGLQLAGVAGVLFVMIMAAIIVFRVQVRGAFYCEFMESGTSTFELLKIKHGNEVEADHGVYKLPNQPRMLANWPPGLPSFMQELVPHEKYVKLNENPVTFEELPEINMTAAHGLSLQKSNAAVMTKITESLERESSLSGMLADTKIILIMGILTIAAVGGSAWFIVEKLKLIQQALGAL